MSRGYCSRLTVFFLALIVGEFLVLTIEGAPLRDSMRSPTLLDSAARKPGEPESSFFKLPASWSIRIYQRFVSPVNGRYCQMYPSCSRYASAAIKKYGLVKGCLMASDRIHRCGHDLFQYKKFHINDKVLFADPVP
jgi:putative membrane protein insertion efficiency factor